MDRKQASILLEEELPLIFSWSVAKVYEKSEAEDLAQEIVYQVLRSIERLENDEAFWSYVWKIAENTLRKIIRKRQQYRQRESIEADPIYGGTYWTTPEDEVIRSEEVQILRRELSLLSSQYRNVTVQYYIYGKSCSQISTELDISVEMVKYYLFKTRKILKEGIGMTRKFGEKSYNPQVFRMDYWGDGLCDCWSIFKRKLPGNILLAAKDSPVSLQELSMELGVAVAYLEDDVEILESHELLKKVGEKYQTNIIIFTNEYEKCVLEKFKPVYTTVTTGIYEKLEELLPELKKLMLSEWVYDDNCMKWIFANIAMSQAVLKHNGEVVDKKYGTYPLLSNGSHGFVFGYDNDYENLHLNGVYNYDENSVWLLINNFRVIERCQHWTVKQWDKCMNAMTGAVLGSQADEENEEVIRLIDEGFIKSKEGNLSANFPVLTKSDFEHVKELLTPVVAEAFDCIAKICIIAEETLKNHVPHALKKYCGHLACVHYQVDSAALIMEEMVRRGLLTIPKEKKNVCMFAVKE